MPLPPVTLGDGVDPAKIEAVYKNGVLTVKLPKNETKPPDPGEHELINPALTSRGGSGAQRTPSG